MALIKCPVCGREISDQSKQCVHCGFVLVRTNTQKICRECGHVLSENDTICRNCGCPVDTEAAPITEKRATRINHPDKKKKSLTKIIVPAIIALVVIAAIIVGLLIVRKGNYVRNLQEISLEMLNGAAEAESAGNLLHKVWYNAIFNEYDEETDKYTIEDGYFVSDFNDALGNLFEDPDYQDKIQSIRENQYAVTQLMKKMYNPPQKLQEAYSVLKEYYSTYFDMTNLVVNPTGSLETFTATFNEYDSNLLKCYQQLSLYY